MKCVRCLVVFFCRYDHTSSHCAIILECDTICHPPQPFTILFQPIQFKNLL